jgi:hypothetical protein
MKIDAIAGKTRKSDEKRYSYWYILSKPHFSYESPLIVSL